MKFKKQTIEELKEIMVRDYKASLSEEELVSLGTMLLRLTRPATVALARADEKKSSPIQARESSFLGANTSEE